MSDTPDIAERLERLAHALHNNGDDPDLVFAAIAALEAKDAEIERLHAAARPGPRWRHVKRGTEYEVIFPDAELQISTRDLIDGDSVVVYRGNDGKVRARLEEEFHDGRFVPLPAPPQDGSADHEVRDA